MSNCNWDRFSGFCQLQQPTPKPKHKREKMSGKQREKKYTRTTKAYKNAEFLGSSVARNIRILCEYEVSATASAFAEIRCIRAIRSATKTRDV